MKDLWVLKDLTMHDEPPHGCGWFQTKTTTPIKNVSYQEGVRCCGCL